MTGTHRAGRSPAPMADQDGPAAVEIAERSPRWVAMITTILLAVLPGLEVTQHSPAVLSRGHVPVALAYLAVAAAVSIWGCWRGWRMGLRLDDHGVTVRNFFHSHQFGWHEVSRFADGSVHGGEAGRLWALSVVLRDGHVITASGTSWGRRDARPPTLAAIRQAAGRYAIPAPLTGRAMRPESPQSPANPGRYPDPGGQPGSRYWSGREWSPFLRPDPASGGPEGATASAEVWSPLPGSEQQWHDAAARARRAGIAFTVWLAATAAIAAVMVALYARDLSKPHADFTSAVWALIATGFGLLKTYGAGAQRRHLRRIDREAQAAARAADGQGSTVSVRTNGSSGMEGQADVQQVSAEQRNGARRADTPAGDARTIASGLAEDATPAGAGGSMTPAGVRGGALPSLGSVIAIGSAVAIGGAFAVGVFSGITGIQSAWAAILLGWLVGLAMRRSRRDSPTAIASASIALAGSALASLIAVTLRIVKEAHVPLTVVLDHMPLVARAIPRDIGWFGFVCWALAAYLGYVTVSRGGGRQGSALPPATPSGQQWPDAESH